MSDEWLFSPKKERACRNVTATLGIGGAVFTVLVFSILFFTDVRFTATGVLSLSLHFSLLFFSSYVMYFSLFETGRDKGEAQEDTRAIRAKRNALFARYEKEPRRHRHGGAVWVSASERSGGAHPSAVLSGVPGGGGECPCQPRIRRDGFGIF